MTVMLLLAVALISFGIGFTLHKGLVTRKAHGVVARAREQADRHLSEAREEAAVLRREHIESASATLDEKRKALQEERNNADRALRRSRKKLTRRHDKLNDRTRRVNEREFVLDEAQDVIDSLRKKVDHSRRQADQLRANANTVLEEAMARRQAVKEQEQGLERRAQQLESKGEELGRLVAEQTRQLERVSGLTAEEAREALRTHLIDEARLEASAHIKDVRDQARLTANREARKIVLSAIQRTAASHAIENAVSVVNIQSDEMKGRIIGREGRNIRAFEAATGIEVIVDDTPEAVILSGFDPVRREIARIALNKLVQDGRIHPARIEEVVKKTTASMEEEIIEIGERAIIELNLHGLHPELIRNIGRMRYRTSYGQNLLAHSIETARIASMIAAEVGLEPTSARRAGLLHDIGKVIEDAEDQPHALAGRDFCRRYKEAADICNAVGAHHDEIEMTALISPVVQAADAISGARPGARRESLEAYIKRLEELEQMAGSFDGVERVFAIQAGREIRVVVNHERISDKKAARLSDDISKRIQDEMQYPGQIKVTVIREVRSVSYAK